MKRGDKVKSWTWLFQFEVENAALRETNKQQEAQILELQKQVQGKMVKS